MSKPITIGQSHTAMSILALNTNWDALDSETLQQVIDDPKRVGAQFTAFLKNGGRIIVGEPKIVPIDRTKPFNPAEFIGAGWTIWKGPKDGNGLSGDEEQDERSLALTEVDLTAVQFKTMLEGRETSVKGETKLEHLKKAGNVRLDAKVFQTLWENQHLIPERWKEQTNGNTTFIYFDGTVLRGSLGDRCVLCLCWGGGAWGRSVDWLGSGWHVNHPSAVLAS